MHQKFEATGFELMSPNHDSTLHVTEMPNLTIQPSVA